MITPTATPEVASKNRMRHALIAVLMQLLVSLTYSYSVFRVPLGLLHGWSKAQTIAPYRYMLLMVSTGGLMIGAGCLLAVWFGDRIGGLILTFGIIVGLGVGLAYVTPIANLLK